MEIYWILGALFIFMTILSLVIAFFLPEWIGITGKKAKEIIEHQQGETSKDDPAL